jgi:hypothetical protein
MFQKYVNFKPEWLELVHDIAESKGARVARPVDAIATIRSNIF